MRRRSAILIAALSVMCSLVLPTTSASADDPPFVGWSALMPPLTYQYEPTSLDDCVAGRVRCVESTIRTMQKQFDPLAASCSHQAVFALTYLRTTQAYLQFSQTPGSLSDPAFVNHEDVAFAQMYFDAYRNWRAGRISQVPMAWRIAFRAADSEQINGLGNLLLGMNAHVNRDLPFVLAGIGLTKPDGTSRKPDHDQIDKMLNHIAEPVITEASQRFDPQIPVLWTPLGIGYTGFLQALVTWRETAWRFAELLVSAPNAAAREIVAQSIETYAAATARAIVAASAYLPPVTSGAARDSYCAAH